MATVGSYEAKTHLPKLLERVAKGERITITKHGVPIAVLHGVGESNTALISEVIAEMKSFRRGNRLSGDSLKEMVEVGRR